MTAEKVLNNCHFNINCSNLHTAGTNSSLTLKELVGIFRKVFICPG